MPRQNTERDIAANTRHTQDGRKYEEAAARTAGINQGLAALAVSLHRQHSPGIFSATPFARQQRRPGGGSNRCVRLALLVEVTTLLDAALLRWSLPAWARDIRPAGGVITSSRRPQTINVVPVPCDCQSVLDTFKETPSTRTWRIPWTAFLPPEPSVQVSPTLIGCSMLPGRSLKALFRNIEHAGRRRSLHSAGPIFAMRAHIPRRLVSPGRLGLLMTTSRIALDKQLSTSKL
ncbi:hypothetical protein MAPG_10145 [Magnaporthiopsis poae ATCC 64411]|uniref:Uncharacterized protein n=1 Tax=Magnaporthiopsis poae (strain ATCC 64411 / 73-15) TaxID=644358 RepID=A0A0C4EBT6_MAGP6|nr:hypothetical protein MAPG_10145 [Magnaporthiopsis poae ATCC 64411]